MFNSTTISKLIRKHVKQLMPSQYCCKNIEYKKSKAAYLFIYIYWWIHILNIVSSETSIINYREKKYAVEIFLTIQNHIFLLICLNLAPVHHSCKYFQIKMKFGSIQWRTYTRGKNEAPHKPSSHPLPPLLLVHIS